MKPRERKSERILWIFIAISLLFHVGLGIFLYSWGKKKEFALPPATAPAEQVVFVNPQDMLTSPTQMQGMEIADIARPKVEAAPKKARFVSQYNSSVKDEHVARRIPPKAKLNAETAEDEGDRGSGQKIPEKPAPKLAKKPAAPESDLDKKPEQETSLSDLSLKPTDFSEFKDIKAKGKKNPDATDVAMKEKESLEPYRPGRPGIPGAGDHFAHDFFPNIKIGDKTYLNTAAMPEVQYFTQLKRIFRIRFNPEPPLRAYFSGNRVVLGKVNVTMAVTVSPGGQIEELFVVKSSGIPGYDQEALQTIRESSPFKSPPGKFLDKSGKLRMTWSFITYL